MIDHTELVALAVAKARADLGLADDEELSGSKFATALGLEGGEPAARVRYWLKQRGAPDYEATIAILEYLGWLSAAAAGGVERAPATVGSTSDERWRDQVDRQLEHQAETLRQLMLMVQEIHERTR